MTLNEFYSKLPNLIYFCGVFCVLTIKPGRRYGFCGFYSQSDAGYYIFVTPSKLSQTFAIYPMESCESLEELFTSMTDELRKFGWDGSLENVNLNPVGWRAYDPICPESEKSPTRSVGIPP